MTGATLLRLLAGVLVSAVPAIASAEIYRWSDERGTTHYADGLDNVPERFRARAMPMGLRNTPPGAAAPTAPEGPGAAGGTTIRFTPGQRIMVDARLNGAASARLLLDTGADRTVISPRALVAAGLSLTRGTAAGQIRGVTGSAQVQGVALNSLEVGEARVGRMMVISHDLDQPGIDGLLGRDFLEQFNVGIDSARGVVTISPK